MGGGAAAAARVSTTSWGLGLGLALIRRRRVVHGRDPLRPPVLILTISCRLQIVDNKNKKRVPTPSSSQHRHRVAKHMMVCVRHQRLTYT
jgi:hypothetical protein